MASTTNRRLSDAERAERRRQDRDRLQQAARELLTSEGWECYAALCSAVPGLIGFMRAITAGAIIETANMVELIFDVPATRAPANRYAPLVDLIPPEYPEATGLQAAQQDLDPTDVAWIRNLRNTVAAHIEPSVPLSTLTGQLDGIDAGRLTDLFHHIGNVLVRIDNAHPITVFSPLVRLRNRAMADVRRIDDPAFNKNYGA